MKSGIMKNDIDFKTQNKKQKLETKGIGTLKIKTQKEKNLFFQKNIFH